MHPAAHAQTTPDKPAIVMGGGERVTYRELNDRSNQCAQLFASLGLVKDDAVALFMDNSPHYFYAAWGALRSGLYYTPMSTHLSADETAYIVDNCDARVVICSYSLREVAGKLMEQLPDVDAWFMVGGTEPGFESFEAALNAQSATPIPRELEGCEMLYSSGTTGYPKGIRNPNPERPFGEPGRLVIGIMHSFGINPDTVYLSPAPMYHAAPLRFCLALHRVGATCVVMEHFDPEEALRLIQAHRVTLSQWVPTMLIRMLKLPEAVRGKYDLSSQQVAIHSAAPCPVAIKRQMIEWWGPIIVEFYGATEGHGGTQINSQEWLAHPGSVGKPVHCSVHILDDDGKELPAGEVGAVYLKGGASFAYHKASDKTAGTRHGDMATVGDVGYLDEEGYLYLTDRKANMIISGGVNVYPQEAENQLILHPAVADVAVVGVPNEDLGEEVKAVVQPVDYDRAGPALAQELVAYCRERMSHIKCPKSVDFERQLPRSDAGKLFKRRIRDRYWPAQD
ncbi:MAG: AMP-binding protein [Halioglobus sp.]|nr:AMP-binding protein [Halioglobus sp.]